MSEQALITLGLLQDHDTLLKGYVDEKYKDFAMGYDYYSSIGNVSLTDGGTSGGVTTYNEIITDNTGQIASKETQVAAGGNIIVEKITLGLAAPKYRKWTIVPSSGQVDSVWSDTPPSLYDSVFSNNSWATITACSEAGIAKDIWTTDGVCTKDIVLNTNEILTLEIMGFDHDPLADGSGYAGITIGMKHLMGETRQLDGYNNTNRSFVDLSMCSWLNNDFYNSLPDDLKPCVKEVDKLTGEADGSFKVRTDKMKVFLFSEQEVSGGQDYSVGNEGEQYARFTDTTSRIKLLSNGTDLPYHWWLRSPTDTGDGFCYVFHNGGINRGTNATAYYGVCAGFCI